MELRVYDMMKAFGNAKENESTVFQRIKSQPIRERAFDFASSVFTNGYDKISFARKDDLNRIRGKIRKDYDIFDNVHIWYYREYDSEHTYVITDIGISRFDNDIDDKAYINLKWESIHHVTYDENDEVFEVYTSPHNISYKFGKYHFVKSLSDSECNEFASLLTAIASYFYIDREPLKAQIAVLKDNYLEALRKIDDLSNLCVDYPEWFDSYMMRLNVLLEHYITTPEISNALEDSLHKIFANPIRIISFDGYYLKCSFNPSLHLTGDLIYNREFVFNGSEIGKIPSGIDINEWLLVTIGDKRFRVFPKDYNRCMYKLMDFISKFETAKGNWQTARKWALKSIDTDDFADKSIFKSGLQELEKSPAWQKYTEIDYRKRRLLMPLKDNTGCVSSEIEVFNIDHIPQMIQFPVGHPIPGTIYIGNPFVPNMYIPYEGYEFEFFLSKVNEYCRLLQCLGATEITIKTIKGRSASDSKEQINNTNGSLGVKAFSGSSEKNDTRNYQNDRTASAGIEYYQRFNPQIKPFVPEGLIWYKAQSDWQSQVQQRLMGNMLEFSQRISTKETTFVSSSEVLDIKAQAEYLWAKANINYSEKSKSEFKSSEETEWIVSVKFKSLDEFDNNRTSQKPQKELIDNEEKYKEEVLFYLEDNGSITDIERRFLEKKRVRLGVSEERAKEIEEECMPQLTSEEKEYIEALKELGDADLQNPRIRRMLDHERDDLGISEERALELEKQYCNQ